MNQKEGNKNNNEMQNGEIFNNFKKQIILTVNTSK
jgi:hypothetical protein